MTDISVNINTRVEKKNERETISRLPKKKIFTTKLIHAKDLHIQQTIDRMLMKNNHRKLNVPP